MDFLWTILPTPATPVVMALMYLVIIYWVRRPERHVERQPQADCA